MHAGLLINSVIGWFLQVMDFEGLVSSLNEQGFLLKKGPKLYQLQTIWSLTTAAESENTPAPSCKPHHKVSVWDNWTGSLFIERKQWCWTHYPNHFHQTSNLCVTLWRDCNNHNNWQNTGQILWQQPVSWMNSIFLLKRGNKRNWLLNTHLCNRLPLFTHILVS